MFVSSTLWGCSYLFQAACALNGCNLQLHVDDVTSCWGCVGVTSYTLFLGGRCGPRGINAACFLGFKLQLGSPHGNTVLFWGLFMFFGLLNYLWHEEWLRNLDNFFPPSVVLMNWMVQHDLVLELNFPVGVQAQTMNSELPVPDLSEVANYNLIHRCSNELSLTWWFVKVRFFMGKE